MSDVLPPVDGEGRPRRRGFYLATITDPGYECLRAALQARNLRRAEQRFDARYAPEWIIVNCRDLNAAASHAQAVVEELATESRGSVGVPRVVRVDRQPDSDQPG